MIPTRQVSSKDTSQTAEDRLLTFVESQLELMNKYANLRNSSGFLDMYTLNEALLSYSTINCNLLSLDTVAKSELGKAQEAFDDQYAEKYHEIRAQHNLNSISAQKWLSSKEIDLEIRCQYTAELKRLKADVDAAERKLAFIRRLLDAWDKQLSVIRQLCKNTEIEITQLKATEALGSN